MRKVSYLIGFAESIALAGYAASLLIAAKLANSTVGAPAIETAIYLIFATLIFLTTNGVRNIRSWARTPYLLIQIFMVIAAYTLLSGTELSYKISGAVIGLVAITGLVALLKSPLELN